ncbi:unnamed protein product [Parnassius apollo]|uniref:(apollo) hypothetical protein n=1 Tax=Parnassius apollo TaxID=110799 RepID=A0A8S3XLG4_PARAO|nr:unnamed protein product [Parnassius apollo]
MPRKSLFMAIFFTTAALLLFLFRWCKWLNMGWATFRRETTSPDIPVIKDATVAAIFVFGLHVLPRTFGFLKYFNAKRKSDLPPLKPESAILWWKFVNKNIVYAYFLVIGSGVALNVAIRETKLAQVLAAGVGKNLTKYDWNVSILLVVIIAIILANIMPGVAACCVFLPFVINMAAEPDAPVPWPKHVYLGALGVGLSSSMTFLFPFLYTPAYFCHYTGKVPMKKMVKYSILSAIICMIIIWLAVCFWAPVVWDPSGEGFSPLAGPEGAPEGGGGGGGDAGGGGGGGGGGDDGGAPPPPA